MRASLKHSLPKNISVQQNTMHGKIIPQYIGEFWTAKQRQGCSLHEISYRACFKPQLPHFFIKRFTREHDTVYDPFNGRGTTVLEAGLMNRKAIANDVNPLSKILTEARFVLPDLDELRERLETIPIQPHAKANVDLAMFFHKKTLAEIISLKKYLHNRKKSGKEDDLDRWIRMVATNRLTGHSKGFFSVYTLPPNQAVLPEQQKRINKKLQQKPEYRDIKKIILRKSHQLLRKISDEERKHLARSKKYFRFINNDARHTKEITARSVQLTVTSPPFLDIVSYHTDNWLRGWFNEINIATVEKNITLSKTVSRWSEVMGNVFKELFRITKHGGRVAFEVGELRNGKVKLDETVVPLGIHAGFMCEGILINSQKFTKTSNIWGVKNNSRGTNTNRIVVFRKK